MQTETRTREQVGDRCAAYRQELFDRSPAIQNIFNVRFAEFLDPSYTKGYAAGKDQLLRDAFEARATPAPDVTPAAANPPSAEKLAVRAVEIQALAEAEGLMLSNIESVRRAYQEAGIQI